MTETMTYSVPGMTCGHCTAAVEGELRTVEGVEEIDIDLGTKLVTIRGRDLSHERVVAAIEEAGYQAEAA